MAKTKAVVPSKPVAAKPNPDRAPNALQVYPDGEESPVESMVRVAASPIARGASTARKFASELVGETDITAYVERLGLQAKAVVNGDLSALERMLTTQATTLDAIFNSMASKVVRTTHVPTQESCMRMALKAQAQCAHTVKVLGELKNPRQVSFVKQQNNAAGHQQVNNGVEPVARAHGESGVQPNELLVSEQHGTQTLDARTKGRAGRRDPALEAVGAVDGAAD